MINSSVPERRINHLANAVRYETLTVVLRDRRISLLGFDPATSPEIEAEIAYLERTKAAT